MSIENHKFHNSKECIFQHIWGEKNEVREKTWTPQTQSIDAVFDVSNSTPEKEGKQIHVQKSGIWLAYNITGLSK